MMHVMYHTQCRLENQIPWKCRMCQRKNKSQKFKKCCKLFVVRNEQTNANVHICIYHIMYMFLHSSVHYIDFVSEIENKCKPVCNICNLNITTLIIVSITWYYRNRLVHVMLIVWISIEFLPKSHHIQLKWRHWACKFVCVPMTLQITPHILCACGWCF